jgi:aryl-alcohol dehydrogenase-like predicted oxidoreductase
MEYTKLGNSGMDVSRICLGCMGFGDAERGVHKWVLNDESSQPIIKKALELGITFSIPPMSTPVEQVRRSSDTV